jgi:hypothetical protein
MGEVALIIIYNHQYNKNIDVLESIYQGKFSNIYHLVPFYNGNKRNVIPVYECSYYFQGYIAQGLKNYFREEYTHYFFIADDLILNPAINENNYQDFFGVDDTGCFIPDFITVHERKEWWSRIHDAYTWRIKLPGIEAADQLPKNEEALARFYEKGLTIQPLRFDHLWEVPRSLREWGIYAVNHNPLRALSVFARYNMSKLTGKKYTLPYPVVGSYSDISIVSSDAIKLFCHYNGVFAATKLFVELALPTAMVLSAKHIVTERELRYKGRPLWKQKDYEELLPFDYSLKKLLTSFPEYLYIHPVKLSKWQKDF